jgi:dimeric dUTPase (all-alpha-NTP-PPase superfamily)
MLASIFALQAELNDYVFRKNNIRGSQGQPLCMAQIAQEVLDGHLMVNDLPNQWLSNYARAMEEEVDELKAGLRWKWWSKDEIDPQNIRVELVDVLHFLVSAMIAAGLTPEKLHDIYRQKHAVNLARQDSGYSQATKTEEDNRQVS